MRIFFVRHGFIAATAISTAAFALACGQPQKQPPRSSASVNEPQPQSALHDPRVQEPYDPIASELNPPGQAIDHPSPQRSTLEPPTVQTPIDDPKPQKPFYGPGTTPPADHVLAKTEKPLSDAEVIGVTKAANDGEVQMAELALKKASAIDVKQFAGVMKAKHQKALQGDKSLEAKTKIQAVESDVSEYLKSDTDKTLAELRDKSGGDFDRAYIDAQVKAHKDVLTALDNRLIPSAENGEVKAMLGEMRRTVADHLTKAEAIQSKESGAKSSGKATRPAR